MPLFDSAVAIPSGYFPPSYGEVDVTGTYAARAIMMDI